MANILVMVELWRDQALPVCLEVLGQARRVATELGATLYAIVPAGQAPRYGDNDLISVLATHGADKVVLVIDGALLSATDTPRWDTHGPALAAATEMMPPALLLFGATAGSHELAARAAARLGAAYLHDAWVETRDGQLELWQGSGGSAAALRGDLEFPVVASIPAGRYRRGRGDEEAEVEVVDARGQAPRLVELGWEADPEAAALVLLASEASESLAASAARLARALEGRLTSQPTAARLAIALESELGAVRSERRVALGKAAARCRHADYALEGDAADLAAALAGAVEAGRS